MPTIPTRSIVEPRDRIPFLLASRPDQKGEFEFVVMHTGELDGKRRTRLRSPYWPLLERSRHRSRAFPGCSGVCIVVKAPTKMLVELAFPISDCTYLADGESCTTNNRSRTDRHHGRVRQSQDIDLAEQSLCRYHLCPL